MRYESEGGAHHDENEIEPFVMPLDKSFITSSSLTLIHRPESLGDLSELEGRSGGILETKFVRLVTSDKRDVERERTALDQVARSWRFNELVDRTARVE